MTERRGTKALELWCRRITDGYPGVNVQNMTTSWRDGLAFCAMIHHFRPDLIDFNSLNKDDVYGNNEMAFRTAAEHLGIPALLDAEDMASCSVPDRLSILTYLSQFYQNFGGSSPSRLALSRTKESSNEGISPVVAESPKPKMGPRVGMRREPCAVCGMPVFLAEKLMISRTPYHRTCFRCARCNNQLTPGNYYETEEGEYCCETCPDEVDTKSSTSSILHEAYNEDVMFGHEDKINIKSYQRSLSDEEKTERRAQLTEEMLEKPFNKFANKESLVVENISQTAQMRLNFMASHLLSENLQQESKNTSDDDEEEEEKEEEEYSSRLVDEAKKVSSSIPGDCFIDSRCPEGSSLTDIESEGRVDATKMPSILAKQQRNFILHDTNPVDNISISNNVVCGDTNNEKITINDKLDILEADDKANTSFDTATSQETQYYNRNCYLNDKNPSVKQDTKDTIGRLVNDYREDYVANTSQCLSLVQRRLKIFENSDTSNEKIMRSENSLAIEDIDEPSLDVKIVEDIHEDDKIIDDNEISFKNIHSSSMIEDDKSKDPEVLILPDKIEKKLPPVVPKRVALEARRAARSRAKNNVVTDVLNATAIDLSAEEIYPEDLNPFKSDEEEETEVIVRKKVSTNPFGSSDEDDEETQKDTAKIVSHSVPRPAIRNIVAGKNCPEEINQSPTKRRLKAPQINLNPFWSDDDEDHDTEDECGSHSLTNSTPIPKPRTITSRQTSTQRKTEFDRGDIYASNSSLGSTGSASTTGGTYRKKKPAPPPPIAKELFPSATDSLFMPNRAAFMGSNNSLHTTQRGRKTKAAPPPPMPTSTPCNANLMANLTITESPITNSDITMESEGYKIWEEPKVGKDEANRNKQSMTTTTTPPLSCNETNIYGNYTDKSVQGKWKRKKGPAPARPIPHKRKIKVMSLKDVKLELDEIEMQQQGLEKQGVRLEQLIRDKAETGNASEETSLGMDVEELVLELFVLVNEKNELFRRQAELMLLRRQQRLEEEHADIEYQIRCLLCQPEATKTDFDKQREETLIQRLVEIVERRNEIVECLEMDRRREVEEDRSINTRMGLYAAKNKGDFAKDVEEDENNRATKKSKKTKLKEKAKEKILRRGHKKDADKDVDETEVKLKRQNKRKWF